MPVDQSQNGKMSNQENQEQILWSKYRECWKQKENVTSSFEGCEMIWDGISCWPPSKPGELVKISCPEYISGFDTRKHATKLCTVNGWWFDQERNLTWTNYTDCYVNYTRGFLPFEEPFQTSPTIKAYIPTVKLISKIGYGLSLAALLIAFAILAINKRLRCSRNLLHLNLFVSFIMRAFMALLKDQLFFDGVGLRDSFLSENGEVILTLRAYRWECKVFTTVWQYCILANYSWILMEGIYLHNLTFMALFLDTSSIIWHVAMGWTLPALFVLPWAFVRATYEDTFCWTTNDNKLYFLIIKLPIVISILNGRPPLVDVIFLGVFFPHRNWILSKTWIFDENFYDSDVGGWKEKNAEKKLKFKDRDWFRSPVTIIVVSGHMIVIRTFRKKMVNINLVLFLNITRVLLNKLNTVTSTRISRYRKWAKSTLILMPLYGVHYALFLGMSYSDDPTVEIVWLFCDQLFGSSQGFCVALLYCILNGEVIVELKRKWHELRMKRDETDFPL